GHLIALKQACLELPDDEVLSTRAMRGLQDAIDAITSETSQLASSIQRTDAITIKQLHDEVKACAALVAGKAPLSLAEWTEFIDQLNEHAAVIDDFVELRWWTSSFLHQTRAYRRDLHLLAPWTTLPAITSITTESSEIAERAK